MSAYSNLSYDELRNLVINGELENEKMPLSFYEELLDNEAGLRKQSAVVLEFCVAKLKQFRKYKKQEDVLIWGNAVAGRLARERNPQGTEKVTLGKRYKRQLVLAAAVLAITLVGCAAIFDFFGVMLKLPLSTPTEHDGRAMLRTEDERFYKTLEDLLAIEQLSILYPATLPEGYAFTNFEVINAGTHLMVKLYATEPYIDFNVMLGTSFQIDYFDYEMNNIKYSVEMVEEGIYQAFWVNGKDYYAVATHDETLLASIIENLQES